MLAAIAAGPRRASSLEQRPRAAWPSPGNSRGSAYSETTMVQRFLGAYRRFSSLGSNSAACAVAFSALALGACSAGGDGGPSQGLPVSVTPTPNDPASPTPAGVEPGTVTPTNPTQPGVTPPGGTQPPAPTDPGGFIGEDEPIQNIGDNPPAATSDGQLVTGEVCNSKGIEFENVVPSVLLLVDRSTSMFKNNIQTGDVMRPSTCFDGGSPAFGADEDRWSAMRKAVAALEPLAEEVMFGMSTYTSFNDSPATCPDMPQLTTLLPGQAAFADILAELPPNVEACPAKKSETPTWEAIETGAAALAAVEIEGPKYLVVITDGEPDSCLLFDPQCGQDAAIGAAQDAFAAGITTFVIGLGDDVGEKFLNDLAHAGQGLEVQAPNGNGVDCLRQIVQANDPTVNFDFNNYRESAMATYGADGLTYDEQLYFAPTNLALLQEQLTKLIAGVRTCDYEMDTAVVVAQANKGAVRVNLPDGTHQDLVYGDPNGWALSADNDYTVTIQGNACDKILADEVAGLQIEFPCEVRVPRIR